MPSSPRKCPRTRCWNLRRRRGRRASGDVGSDEASGDEAPDDPGADDLISARAEDDRPLDHDLTAEALETDSFADVVTSGGGEEAFDFDRLEYAASSLAEHLLGQLHGASGAEGDLARLIAETLDETGYLNVPLADIAALTGAPLPTVERALAIVQELDPPGIAARSLAECLALQAKAADRYDPAMARLIDNLDLLSKGRTSDLKRICGVDDEDLSDMIRELRAYDPKPGCRFSRSDRRRSRLTCSSAAPAAATRSSSTRQRCRGCSSTAATTRSSSRGRRTRRRRRG